ncbi:MAG: hypothetical protein JWM37_269 [Candidatus Saccharibacteria bacterium]|nr:hypothetical protein [Candidatus Saccharibacteria bacterium]
MNRIPSVLLAIVAVVAAVPSLAKADTLSSSQVITVQARVGSRISVAVSDRGVIQQIFSNSDASVSPSFSAGGLEGSSIPSTPLLKRQYELIMADVPVRYGMIYDQLQLSPSIGSAYWWTLVGQSTK